MEYWSKHCGMAHALTVEWLCHAVCLEVCWSHTGRSSLGTFLDQYGPEQLEAWKH